MTSIYFSHIIIICEYIIHYIHMWLHYIHALYPQCFVCPSPRKIKTTPFFIANLYIRLTSLCISYIQFICGRIVVLIHSYNVPPIFSGYFDNSSILNRFQNRSLFSLSMHKFCALFFLCMV